MERNRLHVRSAYVDQRHNSLISCCLFQVHPYIWSFSSSNVYAYYLMLACKARSHRLADRDFGG